MLLFSRHNPGLSESLCDLRGQRSRKWGRGWGRRRVYEVGVAREGTLHRRPPFSVTGAPCSSWPPGLTRVQSGKRQQFTLRWAWDLSRLRLRQRDSSNDSAKTWKERRGGETGDFPSFSRVSNVRKRSRLVGAPLGTGGFPAGPEDQACPQVTT